MTKDKLISVASSQSPGLVKVSLSDGSDHGTSSNSEEVQYNRQRERAMIRERVRRFTQELEVLRDQELENNGRKHVSINTMIRFDSLTGYRFVAYRLVVLLPMLVTLVALASHTFSEFFGAIGIPTFVEAAPTYWFGAVASYAICGGLTIITLSRRFDHYNLATRDQMHEIEQRITQRLSDLQTAFAAAQGSFKVQISPTQDEAPHKQSIINMFTSWRELERLPIYLRHDFTEYFSSVNDDRNFGLAMNMRRWVFILFVLVFVAALAGLLLALGIKSAVAGVAALPIFAAQVCLLLASVFLQQRAGWTFGRLFAVGLIVLSLIILALPAANWIAGDVMVDPATGLFIMSNVLLTAVAGVIAVTISGAVYKHAADKLIVALIRALKTHSKSYAVSLTRRGFKDWTADTQGGSSDWNGWTPDYQDRMREKYEAEGLSEEEIDIRIGIDPVIYVGNEKNRRLQASETDLVTSFYSTLPVVRH